MENIGQRLKKLIEEKEMSLLAFSEKVGIQRSSLSHLFSGRNKPSIDLLLKIKDQFPDTDLEWLITGKALVTGDKLASLEAQKDDLSKLDDVTYVTYDDVVSDNQGITKNESSNKDYKEDSTDIERIILFYKNGSFKEYRNT